MSSNLLAIPLSQIRITTGNNEDWIDTMKYIAPIDGDDVNAGQVDLRGIDFEMEIRRSVDDNEVVLSATTEDGSLSIGVPPDYGYLVIYVMADRMKEIIAGDYVGDVVGRDDRYSRRVIQLELTIVEGVTKWPSPA